MIKSNQMYINQKYNGLFKNSVIETNIDHNEAIKVFGKIDKSSRQYTLINFDTHSDIYIDKSIQTDTIANWVSYMILNYNLQGYFWVLPDFIKQNEDYKQVFAKKSTLGEMALMFFDDRNEDSSALYTTQLYINREKNELLSKNKINHINNKCRDFNMPILVDTSSLQSINVTRCFADELPDYSNKKVILSVDADYFCNTGFDTIDRINNNNITESELIENFEKFLDMLYDKNIRADFISLTLSPIYTPEKYRDIITEFYGTIQKLGLANIPRGTA